MPRPMGTASTTAMAVVSRVPRMNGSSPYLPCVGSHVFWRIQENPRVEKAGRAWTTIETRNHAASAATTAAATARMAR